MSSVKQPATTPQPSQPAQTSPLRVVGWIIAIFGLIPLTMGARPGEDRMYLIVGGAMAALGVILVLLGKARPAVGGGKAT